MKLSPEVEKDLREAMIKTIGTGKDKLIGKIEPLHFDKGVLTYRAKIGGQHIKFWQLFRTPVQLKEDGK